MKRISLKSILVITTIILIATFLIACNETSYNEGLNIVEVEKVKEVYLDNDNYIIIDARYKEEYEKGHLKNAISLPASELVIDQPVPATIAPKAKVESVLSELGITNDATIYVYDESGGVYSSRVWWTLKVYGHENVFIINGGSKALVKADLELTRDVKNLEKADYIAKEATTDRIVSFDIVKEISEDENEATKIIDARSIAEYEAGSIPGSILYPHTKNLYTDGTFMSSRDTFLFYSDKGIERDDEIILYCKSSFRATQALALLEEAGYENVKVYDGAWLEWEANGGEATTVEEDAPVTNQDGS